MNDDDELSLQVIRRFLADKGDVANGIQLVRNPRISRFLTNKMDALSPEERFKVYEFLEGMFPKQFKRILTIRLQEETDQKCQEILRAIAEIHNVPS